MRPKPGPIRVLFLHPETMGLHADRERNPLAYLSKYFAGDYLAIWWYGDQATLPQRAAALHEALGRFRFHWPNVYRLPPGLKQLWHLGFFVLKGIQLSRRSGPYDVIVSYGLYRTALAGIVLRSLTGSKLVVEFPGHPYSGFELQTGTLSRLKRWFAPRWARYVAKTADYLYLRYPWQLDDLGVSRPESSESFHNFTPVKSLEPAEPAGKYILFLGFPFYLKGVDILIRAFNQIWRDFPDYKLRIVGHCPDRTPFIELAGNNPNIEFHAAVPHLEALKLLTECTVFVLPSRTEGMARVLIEAMAARVPVISSAVGGIPYYLRDQETALLFESEDVDGLAVCLRRFLGDREFAAEIAAQGHRYARENLSEDHYAERFRGMISRLLGRDIMEAE